MRRRNDERGIAVPSPIALVSLAAVVLAGVAFVSTSGEADKPTDTARPVTAAPSPTPSQTAKQPVIKKKTNEPARPRKSHEKKAPVRRSDVYVEVFNNSGITGLAGTTANTIAGAGWQVVGSDNWYGTIPASTVYYPDRLQKPAQALAQDLGISRIMPSISPMRFDRLTVILTSDYS